VIDSASAQFMSVNYTCRISISDTCALLEYGMRIRAGPLMRPGELKDSACARLLSSTPHLHLETDTAAFWRGTDRSRRSVIFAFRRVALPLQCARAKPGEQRTRRRQASISAAQHDALTVVRTRLAPRAAHLLWARTRRRLTTPSLLPYGRCGRHGQSTVAVKPFAFVKV